MSTQPWISRLAEGGCHRLIPLDFPSAGTQTVFPFLPHMNQSFVYLNKNTCYNKGPANSHCIILNIFLSLIWISEFLFLNFFSERWISALYLTQRTGHRAQETRSFRSSLSACDYLCDPSKTEQIP